MAEIPADGLTHLRVSVSETAYMGPGRADLLALIQTTGSIAAAGKAMGMSYKRAWSLIQALNAGFGPVVETQRGGAEQGGTTLTPVGEELLARYRHMQELTRTAIAEDVMALRALSDISARK